MTRFEKLGLVFLVCNAGLFGQGDSFTLMLGFSAGVLMLMLGRSEKR